jgi:uncharacterized membrane protein YvbJ
MVCPKCNHKQIFDFIKCPKCGRDVNGESDINNKTYCPSCGANIRPDDAFCPKCGKKLSIPESPQKDPPDIELESYDQDIELESTHQDNDSLRSTKKSKKVKIGCISIAVLFFLFIVLPLMCYHSNGDSSDPIDRQAREELNQEKEQEREKYREQEKENYELQEKAKVEQRKEELKNQGY